MPRMKCKYTSAEMETKEFDATREDKVGLRYAGILFICRHILG